MAIQATLRSAAIRVARSFQDYARSQGWPRQDYRVYLETNVEWGRIHVIFAAREFANRSEGDRWASIMDFLEEDLKGEDWLLGSINLAMVSYDELERAGFQVIGPGYVEVGDLIAGSESD